MTTDQFAILPCNVIVASRSNRTDFDPTALAELGDDIAARGVLSPIRVRPLPASRLADTFENRTKGDPLPTHEIVFGERRWRACNLKGLATIPALISDMTDAEALEAQLVENLQREDLKAVDEARGLEQLMKHSGLTIDELAAKIKKSRRHVYNRLQLLSLASAPALALRKGEIDASRALLIAGIPNEGQQIKALGYAMKEDYYGAIPSVRGLQNHIRDVYMLPLANAKFDTASTTLLPAAGACPACPKRTGAKPDLFADEKSKDLCIDSNCYHAKEQAHSAEQVAAAQAKGQTVIAGKAALELVASGYSQNPKFVGYRRLDDAEDSPTDKPLRKLIGKLMEAEGITPVMIENPKKPGELIAVITNELAGRLLKKALGTLDNATDAKTVSKEVKQLADEKKKKLDTKAKEKFEQAWRDELVAMAWARIDTKSFAAGTHNSFFNDELHRYTAQRTARNLSTDQAAKVCKLLDLGVIGPVHALVEHLKSDPYPADLHMLMIMVKDSDANEYRHDGKVNEGLHLVAGIVYGERLPALIADIKVECAEKYLTALKPAKTTPTPTLAAQPIGLAVADAKTFKNPSPLRKARLSAQEAKSGIAAAMQGLEAAAVAAEAAPVASLAAATSEATTSKPVISATQGALHVGFVLGQRVKVVTDTEKLGLLAAKHAGRIGTITKREPGGGFWDVTFRGRSGGVVLLADDQIEVAA